jgi:hypothetical protein
MKRLTRQEVEALAKQLFKTYLVENASDFPIGPGRITLGEMKQGSSVEFEFYVPGWQRAMQLPWPVSLLTS